jgi:nucleoside-diphosphate-sugar epimerase
VVFTSSIKVLGEQTRRPFDDTCKPSPEDAYGRTKLMAEQVLAETLSPGTTDWCILRPPLVFGAGVRGNFARLLRLARVGSVVPLPLGGIDNRRSTIFVEHLASAIQVASVHQNARRETFVVADDPPTSTSDLLRSIGASMGSRVRLFHVPGELLRAAAAIAGRSAEVQRLLGSLEVDASRFRERTGWKPSIPFQEAIDRTVSATA